MNAEGSCEQWFAITMATLSTKPMKGHIICLCVGQQLFMGSNYSYILDYLAVIVLCLSHLTVYYARTKPSPTVPNSISPCQENMHYVAYITEKEKLSHFLSVQNSAPQGVCDSEEHIL